MERKSDVVDATGDDRISRLPEPILQHILSFVHAEDAARMSTLSKVWDSAWNSLPYLNFGECYFCKAALGPQLVSIVGQALATRKKHKISMQKFSLWLPSYVPCLSYVESWIKILIACHIKELNLTVVNNPIYEYSSLPEAIFAAEALNVLSLHGFRIELPTGVGMIKLSSLQELHLSYVFLDEQFIQALCTSCCNLEVLSLRDFDGLASFQIGETLPKLKKINLQFCPSKFQLVDIAAINLEDLKIYSNFHGNIQVVGITACKSLKTLHLHGVDVTDDWLEELFYSLQNLEKFDLSHCKTLKTMNITSGRLKWLTASGCENLIAADFDTPNLLKFRYACNPLSTFKLKASVLLEATFHLDPKAGDSDWHSKLVKFLANFNHSKAIELLCYRNRVIVIPKDLRENFLPPLCSTHILQVNLHHPPNYYSIVDVIDSMLWISPHLDTLTFTQDPLLKTLKFVYNASDKDEKPCCASLPWKCWRHRLKKVKLQNFTCMEQEKLRNYFFANADILEMVEISL